MSADAECLASTLTKERFKCFIEHFVQCGETILGYLLKLSKKNLNASVYAHFGRFVNSNDVPRLNCPTLSTVMTHFMSKKDLYFAHSIFAMLSHCFPTEFIRLIGDLDNYKTRVRRLLIDVGLEIFQKYEMQMLNVTADEGPTRAMEILAKEAADRIINNALLKNSYLLSSASVAHKRYAELDTDDYVIYTLNQSKCSITDFYEKPEQFNSGDEICAFCLSRQENPSSRETLEKLTIQCDCTRVKYVCQNSTVYIEQRKSLFDGDILNESIVKSLMEDAHKRLVDEIKLARVKVDVLKICNSLKEIESYFEQFNTDAIFVGIIEYLNKSKSDIQRFIVGEDDDTKQNVTDEAKRLDDDQLETKRQRLEQKSCQPIDFQILPPKCKFIGRQEELKNLHTTLNRENESPIVLITGVNGSGKTELTRQYAHIYKNEYKHKIFITAEQKPDAITEFTKLGKQLKITILENDFFRVIPEYEYRRLVPEYPQQIRKTSSIADDIYNHLSRHGDKTLVIFDNAEKLKDIEDMLPKCDLPGIENIHILITSTSSNWKLRSENAIVELPLGAFTRDEALEYIENELGKVVGNVENLIETLNNFPLALKLAVRCLCKQNPEWKRKGLNKMPLFEYLNLCETQLKKLLAVEGGSSMELGRKSVLITVMITRLKIKEDASCGRNAIEILNITAYLSPENIDVKNIFQNLGREQKLRNALILLNDYSMINCKSEEDAASIHRAVQQAVQFALKQNKEERKIIKSTLKCLRETSTIHSHSASAWIYASEHPEIVKKQYEEALYERQSKPIHVLARYCQTIAPMQSILAHHESVIDERNFNKDTALLIAARCDNFEVFKFLVEKGASIKSMDFHKKAALDHAVSNRNRKMIEILINQKKNLIKTYEDFDFTPMNTAIQNGDLDIVQMLLPQNNETQLFHARFCQAVNENNMDNVKKILAESSSAIDSQVERFTLLQLAAIKGNVEVITYLISQGASVTVGYSHNTPLHLAAMNGNAEAIKVLIKNGANIHAIDVGFSALFYASFVGHVESMKILIENGSVVQSINSQAIPSLIGEFSKDDIPIYAAIINEKIEAVRLLIDNGADVRAKNTRRITALHVACKTDDTEIVKLLIENGAHIKSVDECGLTPLHVAAKHNNCEVTRVLLEAGADMNAEDDDGITPFYACFRHRSFATLSLIIKSGADVEALAYLDDEIRRWIGANRTIHILPDRFREIREPANIPQQN